MIDADEVEVASDAGSAGADHTGDHKGEGARGDGEDLGAAPVVGGVAADMDEVALLELH